MATFHRWLAVDPTGEETVTATSHHWLAVDRTCEETVSWPHFVASPPKRDGEFSFPAPLSMEVALSCATAFSALPVMT